MFKNWHWEITQRCNLTCAHCLLGVPEIDLHDDKQSLSYYLRLVSRIKQLGGERIMFNGGEPFMINNFLDIVEYAKFLDICPSVITNGTLINDRSVNRISSLFDVVGISIDGLQQQHDRIRGENTYKKATKVISELVQTGVLVVVYIVVNGINIDYQKQLLNELIGIGVKSFHYNQIGIMGNAVDNKELHLTCKGDNLKKRLFDQIDSVVEIDTKIVWENECVIDPDVAYMSHQNKVFSCVEIKTNNPTGYIADIDDSRLTKKWQTYFTNVTKPKTCAYETFIGSGIGIQVDCGKCLLVNQVVIV